MRPQRVYLASAFSLATEVERVCRSLEGLGFVIPVKWWDSESQSHKMKTDQSISDDEFYRQQAVVLAMARDFGGVGTCDTFVLVGTDVPRSFNGANVELGYALAHHKRCILLGNFDRSAMYAGCERVKTLNELIRLIYLED